MSARNQAVVFAQRTRRNLEFIENAARHRESDVHRVIQITLSLLGLVVFPKEKLTLEPAMQKKTMVEMDREGWPKWQITLDQGTRKTDTLGEIVRHLRNAAAHGRLSFTSDSPDPRDVEIIAEDSPPQSSDPNWRAKITADQLRCFCFRLLDFIEETVG
jgi:hypothetical protein